MKEYNIVFKILDKQEEQVISEKDITKIPYLLSYSKFTHDNIIKLDITEQELEFYKIIFNIIKGYKYDLSLWNNNHINDFIKLCDYLLIDEEIIINIDVKRFSEYFNISMYPKISNLKLETNYDIDIRNDLNNDINTVKTIMKIDYINNKFYVDFAFYILNNIFPKNYNEKYEKKTYIIIFKINIHNYKIQNSNRTIFNRKYDIKFNKRKIALFID